jgi:hypothetical protein
LLQGAVHYSSSRWLLSFWCWFVLGGCLGIVLVPCPKFVISRFCPSWSPSAGENGSKMDIQMEVGMPSVSPALVNSWAQVRSQCFSVKAV